MRKRIIAGNWKMFKTVQEAVDLVNGLKRELTDYFTVDIVVCRRSLISMQLRNF